MAGIDPKVWKLIRQGAKQRGLDPRAVGAVALSEGGLRYGAVGDAGTSFGPFQLHVGGALPRGRGAGWANSPAGINYALNQIAKVAQGKTGRQAISHIVRRFERPAAPGAEIERAWGHYQTLGDAVADMVTQQTPTPIQQRPTPAAPTRMRSIPQRPVFDPMAYAQQVLGGYAAGGKMDFTQLPGIVQSSYRTPAPKQVPLADPERVPQAPNAEERANRQGGTTQHDPDLPSGPTPKVNKALQVARSQIGKPYVWGAEGPKGFDCSGLIEYAFEQAGIKTPGRLTTGTMMRLGKPVNFKNMQPGDWLVRHDGDQQHVVMYVGNGRVIAAPHTGAVVQYQDASGFMGAGWRARRYP